MFNWVKNFVSKILFKESVNKLNQPTNYIFEGFYEKFILNYKDGRLDKKWCLGSFSDIGEEWLIKDMIESPHILLGGPYGAGKTSAAAFILNAWLLANPYRTEVFICDHRGDGDDYEPLFCASNVHNLTWSNGKINPKLEIAKTINRAYSELIARELAFKDSSVKDLNEYETLKNTELSRIVLVFENFNLLLKNDLDFDLDVDIEGTLAWKLLAILARGGAYGISIIALTPKIWVSDMPTSVWINFPNRLTSRDFNTGKILGSRIPMTTGTGLAKEKGVFNTDYGVVYFPYLYKNERSDILRSFIDLKRGCEAHSFVFWDY